MEGGVLPLFWKLRQRSYFCLNFFWLFQLPADELVRHSSAIFSLLRWSTRESKTPAEDLKKAVSSFLLATSQNSVEVLRAFRKERGKIVDKDMVCLILMWLHKHSYTFSF